MHEFLKINSQNATVSFLAGLLLIGLLISFIMYFLFSYRHKQKDYTLLQAQKEKIDSQKIVVEQTLEELKATQSQLIHRERMASLGELTAGIAHEIQNPLNFVNNFSDVNAELLDEAQTELQSGNVNEAASILNSIRENEQKINHHGKRAESIVKGMMQHSRQSTGHKEPIDINALANEYLNLSYHGMRAKDKSFNCKMLTEFDKSLQKINVIPQDIGRLLLNLYNNAFYSVAEKKRTLYPPEGGVEYEPTVKITTKAIKPSSGGSGVLIAVRDNGTGISQKIIDKVFNPFFTTKPTGQGTGLGLSLSYDIIKGHGGTINIETKEGEFAEFIIQLPVII